MFTKERWYKNSRNDFLYMHLNAKMVLCLLTLLETGLDRSDVFVTVLSSNHPVYFHFLSDSGVFPVQPPCMNSSLERCWNYFICSPVKWKRGCIVKVCRVLGLCLLQHVLTPLGPEGNYTSTKSPVWIWLFLSWSSYTPPPRLLSYFMHSMGILSCTRKGKKIFSAVLCCL